MGLVLRLDNGNTFDVINDLRIAHNKHMIHAMKSLIMNRLSLFSLPSKASLKTWCIDSCVTIIIDHMGLGVWEFSLVVNELGNGVESIAMQT